MPLRLSALHLHRFYDPIALVSSIPISLVVLIGAALSLRSHSVLRQDRDLVIHTYQVIGATTRALIAIEDAETGQRGFIITGNDAFLEPYKTASIQTIPKEIFLLRHLVADNNLQLRRVGELERLLRGKVQEMSSTLTIYRSQGFEPARSVVASRAGKNLMDRIRGVTNEVEAAEQQLLNQRSAEVKQDEHRIVAIAIVTTVLSTLLRILIALGRQRLLQRFNADTQSPLEQAGSKDPAFE